MRWFKPASWLFWLNFLVVQWTFLRYARVINIHTGETEGYRFLRYVVPLTGWWSSYKWWPRNQTAFDIINGKKRS